MALLGIALNVTSCADAVGPEAVVEATGLWRLASIQPVQLPQVVAAGTYVDGSKFKAVLLGLKLTIQEASKLPAYQRPVSLFAALQDSIFSPSGEFLRIDSNEDFSASYGGGSWGLDNPEGITFEFDCGDEGPYSCWAYLAEGRIQADTLVVEGGMRVLDGSFEVRTFTFVREGDVTCPTCRPPR